MVKLAQIARKHKLISYPWKIFPIWTENTAPLGSTEITALHHIHGEGGDGAGDDYEVHAVPHLPEEGPRVQHQPVQDDLNKLK